MAAGTEIKLKRKAGNFTTGQLAEGEVGVNTSDKILEFSTDGSDVNTIDTSTLASESNAIAYAIALG
jgi:hypothetical protein